MQPRARPVVPTPAVPLPCLWPLLAAAALLLGLGAPLHAQQEAMLTGRVTDATTGEPIPSALVILQSAGVQTLTSREGTFRLHGLPAGSHPLEVHSIGYATRQATVQLRPEEATWLELALATRPVEMAEVGAEARGVSSTHRLAGFESRREQRLGHFLTRDDIESQQVSRLVDLLRSVPGARIVRIGTSGPGSYVSFGRDRLVPCAAAVYVDGVPFAMSERGLDEISPDQVAAVEVYANPARIPPQFNGSGAPASRAGRIRGSPVCGVIVLWTRVGGTG